MGHGSSSASGIGRHKASQSNISAALAAARRETEALTAEEVQALDTHEAEREDSRRIFLAGLGYDPMRAAQEAREQGIGVTPDRVNRLMEKADPRFNPRLSSFLREFHTGREEAGMAFDQETMSATERLQVAAEIAAKAEQEGTSGGVAGEDDLDPLAAAAAREAALRALEESSAPYGAAADYEFKEGETMRPGGGAGAGAQGAPVPPSDPSSGRPRPMGGPAARGGLGHAQGPRDGGERQGAGNQLPPRVAPGPGAVSSATLEAARNNAGGDEAQGRPNTNDTRTASPGTADGRDSAEKDDDQENEEGDRRLAGLLAGLRGEDVEGLLGDMGGQLGAQDATDAVEEPSALPLKQQCSLALRDMARAPAARSSVLAEGAARALLSAFQDPGNARTRSACLWALAMLTCTPRAHDPLKARAAAAAAAVAGDASSGGGSAEASGEVLEVVPQVWHAVPAAPKQDESEESADHDAFLPGSASGGAGGLSGTPMAYKAAAASAMAAEDAEEDRVIVRTAGPYAEPGIVSALSDALRGRSSIRGEVRCVIAATLHNLSCGRAARQRLVAEGGVQALLSLLRPIAVDSARKAAVSRARTLASGAGGALGGEGPLPEIPGDEPSPSGVAADTAGEDEYADDGFEPESGANASPAPGSGASRAATADASRAEASPKRSLADDERWGTFGSHDGGFISLSAVQAIVQRILDGSLTAAGQEAGAAVEKGEGKAQDGEEKAQDEEEPGLQAAGEAGVTQASEDALVLYLCIRALCNVSGCPEGTEALLQLGAMGTICHVWDCLSDDLRCALAAHLCYNLTRLRSAARKVAEEGGALLLREVVHHLAGHLPPMAEEPDAAPAAGTAHANSPSQSSDASTSGRGRRGDPPSSQPTAADKVVLKSDPLLALRVALAGTPSYDSTRKLDPAQTFSLRRALLSLARLTREPQAAQHVVRTGGAAALAAGAMLLCAQAGVEEDAVLREAGVVALAPAGPMGVKRSTEDDTKEILSIAGTAEGRAVGGLDSLGARVSEGGIAVLSAIHVRRKVAAALCRLSWRQDRALAAVQSACLALGQLCSPRLRDPPTCKIAATALANMLRHPGGAAFAVADGALVALALSATESTSLDGFELSETNEDGVVRDNRLWLQLCARERPLVAVSLYNASCHASSRRMMLKLTDDDAAR